MPPHPPIRLASKIDIVNRGLNDLDMVEFDQKISHRSHRESARNGSNHEFNTEIKNKYDNACQETIVKYMD